MNIKFKIIIFLVVSTIISSCKDEDTTQKKQSYTASELQLQEKLKETTFSLCKIVSNPDVVNEVKNIVEINVDYGRDEEARFRDLIGSNHSIFFEMTPCQKSPRFNSQFVKMYSGEAEDSSLTYIINNDIQIYWPYSEDWDGKETPVVTYAPLDKNTVEVMAYKVNVVGVIDSFIVNEDYAKKHPVWVVNKNKHSYESLPNYIKGESKKNGVLYLKPSKNQEIMKIGEVNPPLNDSTYVYSIYIGSMRAERQWDTWIAGGSEFIFKMVGSKKIITGTEADYSMSTVCAPAFSRKDIDKKVTKVLNSLINLDWGVRETLNGFALWEEDGGSTTQPVKFDVGYDKIKIAAEFKIGNVDDLIYQIALDRNSFFTLNTTDQGNGQVDGFSYYTSGGVYWTMPWKINKRAY